MKLKLYPVKSCCYLFSAIFSTFWKICAVVFIIGLALSCLIMLGLRRRNTVWKTAENLLISNPMYRMTRPNTTPSLSSLRTNNKDVDLEPYPRQNSLWGLSAKFIHLDRLLAHGSYGTIHLGSLELPARSPYEKKNQKRSICIVAKTLKSNSSL